MSQYLNFYVKVPNEETYLPIGTFSRSTEEDEIIEFIHNYMEKFMWTEGFDE